MSRYRDIIERRGAMNAVSIDQLCNRLQQLEGQVSRVEMALSHYSTLGNVTEREARIHTRIDKIEADVAELIRHETEKLFAPSEIWWEKKIFLADDPDTADLDFAAFCAYLKKKFKAFDAELEEWSLLAAQCAS